MASEEQDDEERRIGPGPFARHLGFRIVRADHAGALVESEAGPEHCNGAGIVHGGYLAALLDSATGWAVHALLPVGTAAPHVALSVSFIGAALPGARLTCRASCDRAGRRIASAQAEITQGDRVVARAVTTHAVLLG